MFLIVITLISSLFSAFVCYYNAKRSNANYVFWAAMGIFLGPLAIPFVFFSRPMSR